MKSNELELEEKNINPKGISKFPKENKNLTEQEITKYEFELNKNYFSKFDFLNYFDKFRDIFENYDYDFPEDIRQRYVRHDSRLSYEEYRNLRIYFRNVKNFIANSYSEWFLDIFLLEIENFYENNKGLLVSSLKINSYEDFKNFLQRYRYNRYIKFTPKYTDKFFSQEVKSKFMSWIQLIEQRWITLQHDFNELWTVKDLKTFCKKNQIEIAASMKKNQIVVKIFSKGLKKYPRNPFVVEILSMDNRIVEFVLNLDVNQLETSIEERKKKIFENYNFYEKYESEILYDRRAVLKRLKTKQERERRIKSYIDANNNAENNVQNGENIELRDITDNDLIYTVEIDEVGTKSAQATVERVIKNPKYGKFPRLKILKIPKLDLEGIDKIAPILKKIGDAGESYVLYSILPHELLEVYPEGKIGVKENGFVLEVENDIKVEVDWVTFYNPSLDHDIEMKIDNETFYIEVKTTTTSDEGFSISFNELDCAEAHGSNYLLYHIKNIYAPEEEYVKYIDFYKHYSQGMFEKKKIFLKPK